MKKSLCVLVSVWAEWNEKKSAWEGEETHKRIHTYTRRRDADRHTLNARVCDGEREKKRDKQNKYECGGIGVSERNVCMCVASVKIESNEREQRNHTIQ